MTSCIVDRLLEMSTVLTKRNFRSRIEDIGLIPICLSVEFQKTIRFDEVLPSCLVMEFYIHDGTATFVKACASRACHKSNPLAANGNSKASRAEAKFSHMSSEETKNEEIITMKCNCIVFRPSCDMRVCRYICVCDCVC